MSQWNTNDLSGPCLNSGVKAASLQRVHDLSAQVDAKLVLDLGALGVSQHEGPQHQAPHVHQIEQCLIHWVLLY